MGAVSENLCQEARAIVQHQLDETGAAYGQRDFARYATHFNLPFDVHSFGGVRLVTDLADLYDLYSNVLAYFDTIGLTALERDCIAAEFDGPDTIKATHITRVLRGSDLLANPFPALTLMRRIDGDWKIAATQYATDDTRFAKALTGKWETR